MSVKCVSLDDVLYCNTTHHLDFVVEQFSDVAQVMADDGETCLDGVLTSATLSLIHISEPTRRS